MAGDSGRVPGRGSKRTSNNSGLAANVSTGGSGDDGARDNDEDEVFVPIRIVNNHITMTFPFHCRCPV